MWTEGAQTHMARDAGQCSACFDIFLFAVLSHHPTLRRPTITSLSQLADGRVDLERVQELAVREPVYDSHPTLTVDEEHGGRGGSLLNRQVSCSSVAGQQD